MGVDFYCGLSAKGCDPVPWKKTPHNTSLSITSVLIGCFVLWLMLSGSFACAGNLHSIQMFAEKLPGGFYGYRMFQHIVRQPNGTETDITSRYETSKATIPGPVIVLKEGDVAEIELFHKFAPDTPFHNHVSLHVHGVHYDIESDGTLKYINAYKDESATAQPYLSYKYRWNAAPGTAGTWPYHDHNMETHNGAEDKGLFGTLIVKPANAPEQDGVAKEYVFYVGDDAFWGIEINNATGRQTAMGSNPTLTAKQNTNVRFHLIALGTSFHQFRLPGYEWIDPGTRFKIREKVIGPLEKHVFTVKATRSSQYQDVAFSSWLLGMRGNFFVSR